MGAITTYAFNNITANHTISASFSSQLSNNYTLLLSTNLDCVDYTSVPLTSLATCGYSATDKNNWCGNTGSEYFYEGAYGGKTDGGSLITFAATLNDNNSPSAGATITFTDETTGQTTTATTDVAGVARITIPNAWQSIAYFSQNCLHTIQASYSGTSTVTDSLVLSISN